MIGEGKGVGVTSRRDRAVADVIDADGIAGPFRQGHRYDELMDCQLRRFPCVTLLAVAKPPPGAGVHKIPPVKAFEHSQSARVGDAAGPN